MQEDGKILVIDDEEDILLTLRFFLKQHFGTVHTEHNPNLIPRLLRQNDYDVILLDMNFRKGDLTGADGLRWLTKVMELNPSANVIMITAHGDVNLAVEAVKKGAIDFVVKPWRNEKLLATINSAYKLSQSKQKVQKLQTQKEILTADIDQQFDEIVGSSAIMNKIFSTISKVAKTDANVLVLGENGTGKELIARSIYKQSQRSEEVFISVDLGAIPESLFESELFGHTKGSFTNAYEDRVGRFEVANKGTLFLDEIGNLSLPLQAKLLTALQSRQVRKIGSNSATDIDIRLICATNMPLYEMVKENKFRQDLLYRINTVEITLPALRERGDDIPLLANHFLGIYSRKYLKPNLSFSIPTLEKLQNYDWPGNIRELRHTIERAIILCDSKTLGPDDFLFHKDESGNSEEDNPDNFNLAEVERWTIQKAMKKHHGNITKAAKELGITRAALYRRMEKYGL